MGWNWCCFDSFRQYRRKIVCWQVYIYFVDLLYPILYTKYIRSLTIFVNYTINSISFAIKYTVTWFLFDIIQVFLYIYFFHPIVNVYYMVNGFLTLEHSGLKGTLRFRILNKNIYIFFLHIFKYYIFNKVVIPHISESYASSVDPTEVYINRLY